LCTLGRAQKGPSHPHATVTRQEEEGRHDHARTKLETRHNLVPQDPDRAQIGPAPLPEPPACCLRHSPAPPARQHRHLAVFTAESSLTAVAMAYLRDRRGRSERHLVLSSPSPASTILAGDILKGRRGLEEGRGRGPAPVTIRVLPLRRLEEATQERERISW
jgi:hypothetical protein